MTPTRATHLPWLEQVGADWVNVDRFIKESGSPELVWAALPPLPL